jgi:hypothetical protein
VTTHADHPTARWYQRVVPVVALGLAGGLLLVLVSPGVREQLALSASHRPQEYAALSFARAPAGTVEVCTGPRGAVRVRFSVESHLREARDLAYEVSVGTDHRLGTLRVAPGETTDVTRRLPRPADGAFSVVVRVPELDEHVLAHCAAARS